MPDTRDFMTKRNALITNEDSSRKLARKAETALLKGVASNWAVARQAGRDIERLTIEMANRLRAAGIQLQEAAGHEQIGFEWWHKHQDKLPQDLSFKALKVCVHLARASEQPFEKYDEVKKAQQLFFEAIGDATPPKRLTQQVAHESNPWSEFINETASLLSMFDKLEDEPLQNWGREKLEKFVETTQPIFEKHVQAAAALELLGK